MPTKIIPVGQAVSPQTALPLSWSGGLGNHAPFTVDLDVFGPGQAGNGRQLVRGRVVPWSGNIRSVEWRVGSATTWTAGAGVTAGGSTLVPGDIFEFWVHGDAAGPHGPVFAQYSSTKLEIRIQTAGMSYSTIFSDTVVWPYEVRDIPDHMLTILCSPPLTQSQVVNALFTSWGMGMADIYSAYDDIVAQKSVSYATWSLPIWENQLQLPTLPTVSMATRRETIRQSITGSALSRAQLIGAVVSIVGGAQITDTYSAYRCDLHLTLAVTQTALKALAEEFVARVKPVGIAFVMSYGGFQAGISHAGDQL